MTIKTRVCAKMDSFPVESLAHAVVTHSRQDGVTLIQFPDLLMIGEVTADADGAQWIEFDKPDEWTDARVLEDWLETREIEYTVAM
ncbi:hypothetical protein [Paraburkholderia sp. J8-2]|uniref:hypothetical protein n=1 Tax=Paraburkholderia sp. J8-2 TaxID=2805440 RepID=UPI002AB745AD|nr:hypothetical protein [Paraburkholderia sp. J8-2]